MGTHGVRALVNDSTEVGPFNWTPQMIEQFKRLRGYDPTQSLPILTGTMRRSGLSAARMDPRRCWKRTCEALHLRHICMGRMWQDVTQLDGAWEVVLQAGRGAPASIKLQRLAPLSEQSEPGGEILTRPCVLAGRTVTFIGGRQESGAIAAAPAERSGKKRVVREKRTHQQHRTAALSLFDVWPLGNGYAQIPHSGA